MIYCPFTGRERKHVELKSIFISGGAGFTGSNFVRYLLKSLPRTQLVIFDKLTYAGNIENIVSLSDDSHLRFIQGDICDECAVQKAMKGCSLVVHLAAETHVDRSIQNPAQFVQTNIHGTFTMLEAARKLGIERFIHMSTGEVYGNAEAPDRSRRPSLESDPIKPFSPYAATKASADCLALSYWATFGVPIVITRCSNTYGPYQYPEKQLPLFILHALSDQLLPIYGDGHHIRDWIYVDDVCAALVNILTAPTELVAGEIFNISAGEERSTLDNAHAVLNILNPAKNRISFVSERLGHVRYRTLDSHKLCECLGWVPKISFQSGLDNTINWYREHKVWLERSLETQNNLISNLLPV